MLTFYRSAVTLLFNAGFASLVIHDIQNLYLNQEWKFFIYLTNWSLLLLLVRLNLQLLSHLGRVPAGWPSPGLISLSNTSAFVVSASFWLLLFDGHEKYERRSFYNHFEHSLNGLICLVDTLIDPVPIRAIDGLAPLLLGIGYAVFSVVFELVGLTNAEGLDSIYPITRWTKHPKQALLVSSVVVIAMGMTHFLFLLLSNTLKANKRKQA